jgi:hypothetical protein
VANATHQERGGPPPDFLERKIKMQNPAGGGRAPFYFSFLSQQQACVFIISVAHAGVLPANLNLQPAFRRRRKS